VQERVAQASVSRTSSAVRAPMSSTWSSSARSWIGEERGLLVRAVADDRYVAWTPPVEQLAHGAQPELVALLPVQAARR
jgi:hypothetical protein